MRFASRRSKSDRWAAPFVFGPRTLGRTWGTRPVSFEFPSSFLRVPVQSFEFPSSPWSSRPVSFEFLSSSREFPPVLYDFLLEFPWSSFEFAVAWEVYWEVVGVEGMLLELTPPVSAVASSTVVGGVPLRESGRLLP